MHSYTGRKRSGVESVSDVVDDDMSGKRIRSTATISEGSEQDLNGDQVDVPPIGVKKPRGDVTMDLCTTCCHVWCIGCSG